VVGPLCGGRGLQGSRAYAVFVWPGFSLILAGAPHVTELVIGASHVTELVIGP
jgi:hypothetical protein